MEFSEHIIGDTWLDLRDNDKGEDWHWTDSTSFSFLKWNPGEPDNWYGGTEHCGQVVRTGTTLYIVKKVFKKYIYYHKKVFKR